MLRRSLLLAMLVGVLIPASAHAGVKATLVGNFSTPTYITAPPGDTHRLFVVQQSGLIKLIKDGGAPTTFLDISGRVKYVGGEQGLLSMAFAPDYATSHRFFVYYTTNTSCPQLPGCDEKVSEFTADSSGNSASATSENVLITIPHPYQENHNGGQLQFGPDGDLYISVGDGGGANDSGGNAQLTDRLLGKILRISPGTTSYSIPTGNPFSGGALCSNGSNGGSNCPEIWAYGLRNPWRFSFDSATGDMVIGDVGQDRDEEVDYARPGQNVGANYGWPCYEGIELNVLRPPSECSPLPAPEVAPVLAYLHPENCGGAPFCGEGVIGGYVMHDPTLPSLNGCYVYGDLNNPRLRVMRLAQPSALGDADLGPQVATLSTFGQDASGHLYAADWADGVVYRLDSDGNAATDPTCPAPPTVTTGAATNVTFSTAKLNGTVNPSGTSTSYLFDYGATVAYGSSTVTTSAGSGTLDTPVAVDISGLGPAIQYHYRVVALRGGTVAAYGADKTFTTQPPPIQPKHPPVNNSAPVIVGLPTPRATLTCTPGIWSGAISFAYQWLRDAAAIFAGSTYRPSASDVGHLLSCGVTASNADGSASATSATVRVVDLAPPRLTSLKVSPTAFKAARSGPSVVSKGKAGTVVTFRLDERANVTFTVERAQPGCKLKGRCQRETRSNRKAKRCTLWSAVKGSFRITGKLGSNSLRFTGRIGGRALAPRSYRFIVRAGDSAGNLAKPVRVSFSIRH